MKVLSLFSGIGAFERALTNIDIDYELVGFSEIDKWAIESYAAIHDVSTDLNLGDVAAIDTDDLPDANMVTYGFPCQDVSVAGEGAGIAEGTRSGLLYEAERIIEHVKPKYAIAENVKNLIGKRHKEDFDKLLERLDSYGYNNYWEVLNAKEFGIPQNRERVFIVSIRKDIDDGLFQFPQGFDSGIRLKDMLQDKVEEKYYIDNGKTQKLLSELDERETVDEPATVASRGRNPNNPSDRSTGSQTQQRLELNKEGTTNTLTTVQKDNWVLEPNELKFMGGLNDKDWVGDGKKNSRNYKQGYRVYDSKGVATSQTARGGGIAGPTGAYLTKEPNELKLHKNLSGGKWDKIHQSARRVYDEEGVAPAMHTCGGGNTEPKVAVHETQLEPKEQFGRMGRQGVEAYNELQPNHGDTINPFNKSISGENMSPTITTRPEGFRTAIFPVDKTYRIRKLTPQECWRLMGFEDEDYWTARRRLEEKFYNGGDRSNSQMYKQAGNSIVVDVLERLFESLLKENNQ